MLLQCACRYSSTIIISDCGRHQCHQQLLALCSSRVAAALAIGLTFGALVAWVHPADARDILQANGTVATPGAAAPVASGDGYHEDDLIDADGEDELLYQPDEDELLDASPEDEALGEDGTDELADQPDQAEPDEDELVDAGPEDELLGQDGEDELINEPDQTEAEVEPVPGVNTAGEPAPEGDGSSSDEGGEVTSNARWPRTGRLAVAASAVALAVAL